jgi:hypothetical protein
VRRTGVCGRWAPGAVAGTHLPETVLAEGFSNAPSAALSADGALLAARVARCGCGAWRSPGRTAVGRRRHGHGRPAGWDWQCRPSVGRLATVPPGHRGPHWSERRHSALCALSLARSRHRPSGARFRAPNARTGPLTSAVPVDRLPPSLTRPMHPSVASSADQLHASRSFERGSSPFQRFCNFSLTMGTSVRRLTKAVDGSARCLFHPVPNPARGTHRQVRGEPKHHQEVSGTWCRPRPGQNTCPGRTRRRGAKGEGEHGNATSDSGRT